MDDAIVSGDLKLAAHFAVPPPPGRALGLVLCHGLPSGPRGGAAVGNTYPELADRLARWAADPSGMSVTGARARELLAAFRGATDRNAGIVERELSRRRRDAR